ncbi:MAG: peptidyl-prolyl cis-trans isomerase [Verrucomicrobia bacterium]|nr:peptidyl-prolyl cis-trans isomerase [Verrucomicrobiota bacterium]
MFGTIRRHQTWLWWAIIVIIVISFVVFFSPYSKMSGPTRGRADYGMVNGHPISEEEFLAAQRDVYLRYFVTHGDWPDRDAEAKRTSFNVNRETYNQVLLNEKMKDLNIQVSSEAVARLAAEVLRSSSYETFLERVLRPAGFRESDFARFIRHELGIQQMISVLGLSGQLITPHEGETLYRREQQEMATEAVFFTSSNHLASVVVTPEAVGRFYTNQMPRYRLPDRVQVRYVKFAMTNFFVEADVEMAKLTNLNERLEYIYQKRGTNYYREAKSPEEAKEKIKVEMHNELALLGARKAAAVFATELSDLSPQRADNLDKLAAQKKLEVKVTAPFDIQDGPVEFLSPPNFTKAAFSLTEQEPFANPIAGEDGVYVIAFQKKIPSEIQPLDKIREQVTADYRFVQAIQLARQAGTNFSTALTAGLAAGKTFAAVCEEAKVKPVTLPSFSLASRTLPGFEERINLSFLKEIAFKTPVGKTSGFVPTSEGGMVLHVMSQLPVDESRLKADLPNYLRSVRQSRQLEIFNDWFRKQMELGYLQIPRGQVSQQ